MRGWRIVALLALVAVLAAWLFMRPQPAPQGSAEQEEPAPPIAPSKTRDPFYDEMVKRIGPSPATAEDLKKVRIQKGHCRLKALTSLTGSH